MPFDITTQGSTGLIGSETSACSGKLSSGRRTPAISMMTLVLPAAHTPILRVRIMPRLVSSASTAPLRVAPDARDLAVLDDVDAERIGGARIAPGDRIVPRRAAAALQRRAQHRIADVGLDVERRAECLRLFGGQPFIVDAVAAVGMHMALDDLHVVHRVRQHHDAARREHDVVVQGLGQPLPQLQRVIVERGAFIE